MCSAHGTVVSLQLWSSLWGLKSPIVTSHWPDYFPQGLGFGSLKAVEPSHSILFWAGRSVPFSLERSVTHAYKPSTWDVNGGGSEAQGHPQLCSDFEAAWVTRDTVFKKIKTNPQTSMGEERYLIGNWGWLGGAYELIILQNIVYVNKRALRISRHQHGVILS